jgi:hypothetical protein
MHTQRKKSRSGIFIPGSQLNPKLTKDALIVKNITSFLYSKFLFKNYCDGSEDIKLNNKERAPVLR